jgi:hypothetical protein
VPLRDDGDSAPQPAEFGAPGARHLDAVEFDRARPYGRKPIDGPKESGFARAAGTENGYAIAGACRQGYSLEHGGMLVILHHQLSHVE